MLLGINNSQFSKLPLTEQQLFNPARSNSLIAFSSFIFGIVFDTYWFNRVTQLYLRLKLYTY